LNKSFTILIVLALFLGIGSLVLIKKLVESEREKALASRPAAVEKVQTAPVLIVKDNLETGTPLTDLNVGVKQIPQDMMPEGAMSSLDQIRDRFAVQQLFKGEMLLEAKAKTKDQLPKASLMIEKGKRLISVRVDEVKANGYMIKNGDYVDLVGSFNVTEEMLKPGSEKPIGDKLTVTFLQRVRVFDIVHGDAAAAPQDGSSADNSKGRIAMGTNAAFEVTPQQAEIITNAESIAGSIWLVLRRFDDDVVFPPTNDLEKGIIDSLQRSEKSVVAPPPPPKTEKRKTVF
jgi:Flp pilus assembly protein CpaB